MSDPAPVITFLSDYGLADDFVGVCHGVIATICPRARIIDLTHGIGRHDIRTGAILLAQALAFLPVGVHLAVVDPDVGAQRRAIAVRTADGRLLVGPDNGLLWLAGDVAGGIVEAVDIAASPLRLQPVSATFHGRDIFAPVAAGLAAGTPLLDAGVPLDPAELVTLALTPPRREGDVLVAQVRYVDAFGNLQLNLAHEDLAGTGVRIGHEVCIDLGEGRIVTAEVVRTFADAARGALLIYEDAHRRLAVAVSQGDAAERLGVGIDAELRIRPA
jgi:S-adenosylmethionine hydrolase